MTDTPQQHNGHEFSVGDRVERGDGALATVTNIGMTCPDVTRTDCIGIQIDGGAWMVVEQRFVSPVLT